MRETRTRKKVNKLSKLTSTFVVSVIFVEYMSRCNGTSVVYNSNLRLPLKSWFDVSVWFWNKHDRFLARLLRFAHTVKENTEASIKFGNWYGRSNNNKDAVFTNSISKRSPNDIFSVTSRKSRWKRALTLRERILKALIFWSF